MKRLLKLGFDEADVEMLLENKENAVLFTGPMNAKLEKVLRIFEDLGAKTSIDTVAGASLWLGLRGSLSLSLARALKGGFSPKIVVSQRRVPVLCPHCKKVWTEEGKNAADLSDAKLFFTAFPEIDFRNAMEAPGCDLCQKGVSDDVLVVCEILEMPEMPPTDIAVFERSWRKENPEKSMAAKLSALVAKGMVDPAQGARFGGLLNGVAA